MDAVARSMEGVINMGDLIDRNAAIEAVRIFYADECALVDSIEEQLEKLPSAQPEPIKIHLDHELTKEECERLMRIGDSPVMAIPPDRQEITLESAIDYLHSIGWMQEHDELMYKQGYKHGKSKGIKRGMAMARRKEAGGD